LTGFGAFGSLATFCAFGGLVDLGRAGSFGPLVALGPDPLDALVRADRADEATFTVGIASLAGRNGLTVFFERFEWA
jgi:hypothetical protein